MPERIGFIGLGIMGKPMTRNLLKAGYALVVHDCNRAPVDEMVHEGVSCAGNAREVAERSDVVITMLPDSPDVEAVALGPNGIFAGAHEGLLFIDMSTISPVVTRRLAEQAKQAGIHILDAPVSGGDKGAIAGTLSIMVGGDAADFQRAEPIFGAMGKTITLCGPSGAGQVVKACNQVAVALTIAATSEALVLGTKAGVDPEIILKVLGGGLAQSRVMDLRGPTMIQHRFEPGFKSKLHHKDLGIIHATARSVGAVLPFTALAEQVFTSLVASGKGEWDHSALMTVIEELSGAHQAVPA